MCLIPKEFKKATECTFNCELWKKISSRWDRAKRLCVLDSTSGFCKIPVNEEWSGPLY